MYYYLPVGKGDGFPCQNREDWATLVARHDHHLKPPTSWLEAQTLKDRTFMAAVAIWSRYPPERKLSIWLMSSDEDFQRAGYQRGPDTVSPY